MKIKLPKFHPNDKVMYFYRGTVVFTTIDRAFCVPSDKNGKWSYGVKDCDYRFNDEELILVNNTTEGLIVDMYFKEIKPL